MCKRPYLSICIPTYNRLEMLQNTISSIYRDLEDVDLGDFEVIVSDNEPSHSSRKIVENFEFLNLHYHESKCSGFMNSFEVLTIGNGEYLKLHNNSNMFRKGNLLNMINEIKENYIGKPLIFHANGLCKFLGTRTYYSFNDFLFGLSYLSSWSTGFGIWREDFEKINSDIRIDSFFPQTSLLLTQTEKAKYIINNNFIFDCEIPPKKGGYNIFKVFSIDFLSLIEKSYLKNNIKSETFKKIKVELISDFLTIQYIRTVLLKIDDFESDRIKENFQIYYSSAIYYYMIIATVFVPFKILFRRIRTFFISFKI